jgi:hypothetical protein
LNNKKFSLPTRLVIINKKKKDENFSLLELDDENFRRFEFIFIFEPVEFAAKKRKLNNGIIAKDDK